MLRIVLVIYDSQERYHCGGSRAGGLRGGTGLCLGWEKSGFVRGRGGGKKSQTICG